MMRPMRVLALALRVRDSHGRARRFAEAEMRGGAARLVSQPCSVDTLGATAGLSSSAGNTVGQANRGTRHFRSVEALAKRWPRKQKNRAFALLTAGHPAPGKQDFYRASWRVKPPCPTTRKSSLPTNGTRGCRTTHRCWHGVR